jgi:hypothetical protein
MTNLAKIALSMTTQDIKYNRLYFGSKTTLADVRRIYEMCLSVATKVQEREMERKG